MSHSLVCWKCGASLAAPSLPLRRLDVCPACEAELHACKLCEFYDTGKAKRRSAIGGRTTRHPGYVASQRVRKRIEEVFGWIKAAAGLRKTKFRGLERVRSQFTFALTAYNLIRLPKLLAGAGA